MLMLNKLFEVNKNVATFWLQKYYERNESCI